jgi:prevent-host-death family protein
MARSARTPRIQVADDIVPIAEFKAHLSQVVRELSSRRRPVVVTHNGKAAAVVLSPMEYDRLTYAARFVAAVTEGLEDADAGRVVSDEQLREMIDQRYGRPASRRTKRK